MMMMMVSQFLSLQKVSKLCWDRANQFVAPKEAEGNQIVRASIKRDHTNY
jgi:hypothetical protein